MSEIKRRIEDRRIELGKRRSDADIVAAYGECELVGFKL